MIKHTFLLVAVLFGSFGFATAQGEAVFKKWDKNGDGFLVKEEVPEGPRKIFDRKDANGDGKISMKEHLGKMSGGPPRPERPERPGGGGNQGGGEDAAFTIRQTWDQEARGFDRPVYAKEPASKGREVPVVIYFHGGGGNAKSQINGWTRYFPDRLIIAPQGYKNGWNVQGENSKAPDVEFFEEVITELGKEYTYADMENVSLIGSSNGAAMIYRLMIELKDDLFKNAVPMVSSLLESQYHDESFWQPSRDTDDYDTRANPIGGRRILYLHGTDDGTVPFNGGLRFGKYQHLSAPETAYIWAKHQGYQGKKKRPDEGEPIGEGLIRYQYEGAQVTFIEVDGGNHGLGPHREAAMQVVKEFLEE